MVEGGWYIIWDQGDNGYLEIKVKEELVMNGCEMVKFELGSLHLEPFEKGNFIIVEVGALKDVKVPLTLLSMSWWVIDVARNGGLS